MSYVLHNKKARFDYSIELKYTAGIMLIGTEVKSIRKGMVNFTDSYCLLINDELWVRKLHISEYANGIAHPTTRDRKLLLKKKEIKKIQNLIKEKGFTIFPLEIFFNEKNLAKIEIGVGKGKKEYDKREVIKKRESDRNIKKIC
jgi:SsrA-binding protein